MKHALLLSLGLAFVATAAPATAHDAIGAAVERHMPKSWFTPEHKAFIQAKCGVDVDSHHSNLNINGSTMTCPDGRMVNDPQVRVISEDISRRVNDYTSNIMKQADVQRAIAMSTRENVRKAIADANIEARVAEAMAHAEAARAARASIDTAQIDRQVRDALAQAEIGRKTAERVRDALAKAGLNDTH
jgi:hypothetical protein